ncbi:hypothetical protein [Sodalis-like endosymbiont of Proechinophthirus fluctus]|uniref:hypothetical protein n=1 Tax=Sodalis-like endosymbiont of Proechinophthirus fluctus TaxID=1462730 RepID=UPI00195787D9|nr:hypothetical protein [Sodalis-like endosymbiont of Proechinophthirus fluctus]
MPMPFTCWRSIALHDGNQAQAARWHAHLTMAVSPNDARLENLDSTKVAQAIPLSS